MVLLPPLPENKATKAVLAFLIIGVVVDQYYNLLPYKFTDKEWNRLINCPIHEHPSFHYHWYDDWLFPGMTVELPHIIANPQAALQRTNELAEARARYEYDDKPDYPGFPPSIKCFAGVVCEEDFDVWDWVSFDGDQRASRNALIAIGLTEAKFLKWNNLDTSYEIFYKSVFFRNRPFVADHWKEDTEFGRQRLAGVDPFLIKSITAFPANFKIEEKRLSNFLRKGKTVKEELEGRRFFLEDLTELEGLYVEPGRILGAPLTLLYQNENEKIVPVAIQFFPDANKSCGVFYPDDAPYAWLFAKMVVQNALGAHHQVRSHLLLTHLTAEVFSIATHRALHISHPVHRILHPHFHKTFSINEQARTFLIPVVIATVTSSAVPGAAQYAAASYLRWNFTENYPKVQLMSRGVYDPTQPLEKQTVIPRYDFRDFAVPLWDLMRDYVAGILRLYYDAKHPIASDVELQNWAKEISGQNGGRMKGFPTPITSFEELVDVVTMVMWTCSAQHAAVNFGQYDIIGWVPNIPLALHRDSWPTSKSQIDEDYVFNSLPNFNDSASQIGAVKVLSKLPESSETLLYSQKWADPRPQAIAQKYHEELTKFHEKVVEFNKGRVGVDAYWYLDPAQIPRSVGI